MDVAIGAGAHFVHARLARKSAGVRIEDVSATVAEGGSYRLHCANFGAQLSRLELDIKLQGEGAEAHLSGVSLLDGTHSDVTTHIDHVVGNTSSTQLFKHVAGGKARAVYQGRITVREGADGSDSRQTAKALLLDERAEADLKPELEISPTTSNAPMARRSAIWMRIRCSICARAAFPSKTRGAF